MSDDDDDDVNPLGLVISDETRALVAALRHMPDRDEIRQLLVRYFEAQITEEIVDRVEKRFLQISSSLSEEAGYRRHFESPTRWRGMAWNEDFTGDRRSMTPSDLVLMLANMLADHDPSFPQPKLYCPAAFVGTWEQVEPRPPMFRRWLWHLSADGTFRCNNPEVPDTLIRWCLHRSPAGNRFSLVLQSEYSRAGWSMWGIEPPGNEIAGEHLGISRNTPFRLRRVS